MLHFAYPNVRGGNFIGCGKYIGLDVSQPGYAEAAPNVTNLTKINSAALVLAPESQDSNSIPYEKTTENQYIGDSQDLAYLLALISCSRRIRLDLTHDIWCTGKIEMAGRETPSLEHVAPNGFDAKLTAFLSETQSETIFLVPAANILPSHKILCRERSANLVSLSQFQRLASQTHSERKTIVQILQFELLQLVEAVFHPLKVLETPGSNPYRGLFAFREEDAGLFFGRETCTAQLVETIRNQPIVALIGASGSGKSSVVSAGVIPELRHQGNWVIVSFCPGNNPFRALAVTFLSLTEPDLREPDRSISIKKLTENLKEGLLHVNDLLEGLHDKYPEASLLIFIDQFEELYTLCQDEQERRQFLDGLLACGEGRNDVESYKPNGTTLRSVPPDEHYKLILTMRADFLGKALAYPPFTDLLQQTTVMLGAMSREELLATIEQPAEKCGVTIETGLKEKILEDISHEPGHLPLLQFTLTELWEQQHNRTLTLTAYHQLGGVERALAKYADNVYNGLRAEEQERAQRIFTKLVRPGEGTEDTRRVATRQELTEKSWQLVTKLASARLVVTNLRNQDSFKVGEQTEDTVEVIHEALIKGWQRLRDWIDKDREFLTWQHHLRMRVNLWVKNDREKGRLLQGTPLLEAEEWLGQRRDDLKREDQEFIEASLRIRHRTQQWKRLGIIGLLLIAVVVATVFAVLWNHTETQRQIADRRAIEALSVSAKIHFLTHDGFKALLSVIKAGKILQRTDVPNELRDGVLTTFQEILNEVFRERLRLEDDSPVITVALSPDGTIIASGNKIGKIILWDIKTGRKITTLQEHHGKVLGLAFNRDGTLLASSSDDRMVFLWDVKATKLVKSLQGHSGAVYDITFHPEKKMLASASEDTTIRLWDLTHDSPFQILSGHTKAVSCLNFSPDGKLLASGSHDGTIKLWDVASGKERTTLQSFAVNVYSVDFSPDGMMLVSGNGDSTIRLWHVISGNKITNLEGHDNVVSSVRFSPDGLRIASGSNDKTIKLWSVENGKELNTFQGHAEAVYDLSFSAEGDILASASWDQTIRIWDMQQNVRSSLSLDELLTAGCESIRSYLASNPNIPEKDRVLCDPLLQR